MEASNLKLSKFDVKVLNEILKDISTLAHELSRLLVRENFMDELIRSLKVGEQKDEYFLWISWYLYEVDRVLNLVEISV